MPDLIPILTIGLLLILASWCIESLVLWRLVPDLFGQAQFCDLFWINALTNPIANQAYSQWNWPWWLVETCVVLFEVYPIQKSLNIKFPKAAFLSLFANSCSALTGLAMEVVLP
ncbi:MAG: hypothetical protein WCJ40_16330 [Planctomycetota bacterium]